eukprot:5036556-Amphidinium_carterae.1
MAQWECQLADEALAQHANAVVYSFPAPELALWIADEYGQQDPKAVWNAGDAFQLHGLWYGSEHQPVQGNVDLSLTRLLDHRLRHGDLSRLVHEFHCHGGALAHPSFLVYLQAINDQVGHLLRSSFITYLNVRHVEGTTYRLQGVGLSTSPRAPVRTGCDPHDFAVMTLQGPGFEWQFDPGTGELQDSVEPFTVILERQLGQALHVMPRGFTRPAAPPLRVGVVLLSNNPASLAEGDIVDYLPKDASLAGFKPGPGDSLVHSSGLVMFVRAGADSAASTCDFVRRLGYIPLVFWPLEPQPEMQSHGLLSEEDSWDENALDDDEVHTSSWHAQATSD